MVGNLYRSISATLLSTALCCLVIPPEIAVAGAGSAHFTPGFEAPAPELETGFPPAHHDFVFRLPDLGVELKVLDVEGGFLFWQDEKPDGWGFVPDSKLEKVDLATEVTEKGLVSHLTVESALGAPVRYEVTGMTDGVRSFYGTLSAPGNELTLDLELVWAKEPPLDTPESTEGASDLRNTVDRFILEPISVLNLICGTLEYLTECESECGEACGESGLESASEGSCGTCECECGSGDGGLEV